jgi:hypothetical protein
VRSKYYLFADAASDHHRIVEQALVKAAKVCIQFDETIFRATLREASIADATIETYLDSVRLIDDIFGYDRHPTLSGALPRKTHECTSPANVWCSRD